MAGKYGSSSITISYDDAAGGSLRNISNGVLTIGGIKITQLEELSHAFGDAWEESSPSGVGKVDDVKIGGFWDTTAVTGAHVVFLTPDSDPNGGTRTLTIVFGDSKTFTVETRLMTYNAMGVVGKLTKFEADVRPTGTPTWS